ncbi:hypothetical protein AKN87_04425 [Thiopseudomonas alkaliphila]|uniref:GIY-YIG nuclease family protein n=1 Tax=Thiopseudomonas alkaliphila TaxID=1697053 RepID=UPI00069CE89C|nr:GIY-YIG nuclease family protein [Thiopseudomonas alkaliphila]AKX44425.1 hypothetical protein AKN87_04425 [Thiopseudomonas alkaliphila]AKX46614.1 hypothetical protein AKN94_04030 [Thiopseudomonas alkaliphila]AKX49719.1 hypothetical protein AKN93_10200 [Thiopseudomonas alkaliphila]AKX52393.1 hypothetical protein AKN91_00910 [Thiopseudomonas alkaliphila]
MEIKQSAPSTNSSAPASAQQPWWVYLIRAENNALYCGISNNPQARLAKHQAGKGARFFALSPAVAMVYLEACADKSTALKRELAIKKLGKAAKEQLVRKATEVMEQKRSEGIGESQQGAG